MAVAVDLLKRVRNIHWAVGARFVLLSSFGQHYIKVTGSNAAPVIRSITLPDSPKGPVYNTMASSYRLIAGNPPKPTFLMFGLVDTVEANGRSGTATAIMISNNAIDWRHVFLSETGLDGTLPWHSTGNALVWSPLRNAFYFDQRVTRFGLPFVETPTGDNAWVHDQAYRSANGESWSGPVSDEQISFGAETMGWRSVFPPTYCTHNNAKDTLEQNVPDGFIHKEGDLLLRPKTPTTINYGIPSFVGGTSDQIEIYSGTTFIGTKNPGVGRVFCVAGAGRVWMAGGSIGTTVSFDDGATWKPVRFEGHEFFGVISISAAPPRDFQAA